MSRRARGQILYIRERIEMHKMCGNGDPRVKSNGNGTISWYDVLRYGSRTVGMCDVGSRVSGE